MLSGDPGHCQRLQDRVRVFPFCLLPRAGDGGVRNPRMSRAASVRDVTNSNDSRSEMPTVSSSTHSDAATRGQVFSWAMWDWGSAAFNAVIVTFVFSVYLTDSVGADLDSPLSAATWLSIALAVAGLVIALTAPVMGQRADRAGRRRRGHRGPVRGRR